MGAGGFRDLGLQRFGILGFKVLGVGGLGIDDYRADGGLRKPVGKRN